MTLRATTSPSTTGKPDPVNSTCPLPFTVTPGCACSSTFVSNSLKDDEPTLDTSDGVSIFNNCADGLKFTTLPPGTAATATCPPGADNCPVLATVPPNSVRFCPVPANRFPEFTMALGCAWLNCTPKGTVTVSNGGAVGFVALNCLPSPKFKLLAVLPTNEPPISNEALGPKIIPLGLSKNRLAFPSTPSFPKIFEAFVPVTRLKIFSIPAGLLK
ncbi:hypothetical protein NIES4073_73840 [Kalymmatonema gypsitolerans NIES-4073]|nr:hypothetical protein NIES4073_73840 [Scytonema sp. NIES-4073]